MLLSRSQSGGFELWSRSAVTASNRRRGLPSRVVSLTAGWLASLPARVPERLSRTTRQLPRLFMALSQKAEYLCAALDGQNPRAGARASLP